MGKGGTSRAAAGCSVKRRGLFRVDLERLPSVSVAKNPNNRQERAQANDNWYDNGERIDGSGYVCEGPLRERRDCAM